MYESYKRVRIIRYLLINNRGNVSTKIYWKIYYLLFIVIIKIKRCTRSCLIWELCLLFEIKFINNQCHKSQF